MALITGSDIDSAEARVAAMRSARRAADLNLDDARQFDANVAAAEGAVQDLRRRKDEQDRALRQRKGREKGLTGDLDAVEHQLDASHTQLLQAARDARDALSRLWDQAERHSGEVATARTRLVELELPLADGAATYETGWAERGRALLRSRWWEPVQAEVLITAAVAESAARGGTAAQALLARRAQYETRMRLIGSGYGPRLVAQLQER